MKAPANIDSRDWTLPLPKANKASSDENESIADLDPTKDCQRYIAEVFHIIRPICHCIIIFLITIMTKFFISYVIKFNFLLDLVTSVFVFDSKSWTQYFVALSIDTAR